MTCWHPETSIETTDAFSEDVGTVDAPIDLDANVGVSDDAGNDAVASRVIGKVRRPRSV